jgi:hypothetical protein
LFGLNNLLKRLTELRESLGFSWFIMKDTDEEMHRVRSGRRHLELPYPPYLPRSRNFHMSRSPLNLALLGFMETLFHRHVC